MKKQTKHTSESVANDLKKEFESLSQTEWSESGDVNMELYGGVRYRKTKSGDQIDVQFFRGTDDSPKEIPDRIDTTIDLSDLLECIDEIWTFADVGNCGLTIGYAIMSRNQWDGFLSQMHGWYFSE